MAQTQIQKTKTACSSSNNGGFRILKENIDNWTEHGDWEPLAYLLKNHREAPVLRRAASYVLADHVTYITGKDAKGSKWGAKIVYDKKANSKLRLNTKGEASSYDDLKHMVAKNMGIKTKVEVKGKNVIAHTHYFPSVKPADDRTDAEKLETRTKATVKWLEENGLNVATFVAALKEQIKA